MIDAVARLFLDSHYYDICTLVKFWIVAIYRFWFDILGVKGRLPRAKGNTMRRCLIILAISFLTLVISKYGFCANYDATGVWEYSTNNPSNNCGDPNNTKTGFTAINQNGDTFTYTDKWGIYTGRISGANYTATKSYPEDGGVTTETILFTLTSDTAGTGTLTWTWTYGTYECEGHSDITITKQPAVTRFDATGIWDYSTFNAWNNCDEQPITETDSVSITQDGNTFRYVYRGTQSGFASAETYIAVVAYPEDQGTTTESILFTLSSNTFGTGTVDWVWTEGIDYCSGGNDFSITKRAETNTAPYKPTLSTPADGAINVFLTPNLKTKSFVDPDTGDKHKQTEWQISKKSDFSSTALITIRDSSLTSLAVPKFVLVEGNIYFWRARFYDDHSRASDWSHVRSFKTLTSANDLNGDGIPDDQENSTVDLDGDGVPDSGQDYIKSLNTVVGNVQMGISLENDPTVTAIGSIESIDPATISDIARPYYMPFGLFGAELTVLNPSDPVEVTIYFSQPAPDWVKWYVHNPVDGWVDYSEQATFSSDRKSVRVKIKDWGYGDSDGIPNGTIIDPGGAGLASWINGYVSDFSTHQPITDAVITISSLALRTVLDGHYLSMIRPGTFSISVSAKCYETSNADSVVIPEGGIVTKDYSLVKSNDSDGDGAPNSCDAFPNDPSEWLDVDGDGIGNHSDIDDDNDGMSDEWELQNNLNPHVNDAAEDADGDGYSNTQEYRSGTDPNNPNSKPSKALPWIQLLLFYN